MTPRLRHRVGAELVGTFWIVLAGVGTAVFGATYETQPGVTAPATQVGAGILGVAVAFGLAVTTMTYAVGHVSGGHFNPAVTVGLWAARRFDRLSEVGAYVAAQLVGGLLAGAVVWGLARTVKGADGVAGSLLANGFGDHSALGFSWSAVLLVEILVTAFLVFVVLGATTSRAPTGFAPLAIGLTVVVLYLETIAVDGGSANPARSLGVAVFDGNGALGQVWLFLVAPVVGAVVGGWSFTAITGIDRSRLDVSGAVNPGEVMVEVSPGEATREVTREVTGEVPEEGPDQG